jgi:hypothetical protein
MDVASSRARKTARLGRIALLAILFLFSSRPCHSQVSCDPKWLGLLRWQGTFSLTAVGNGADTSGTVINIDDSASASFDLNYLTGTIVFTNDFGAILQTTTASCAPSPGQQITKTLGNGRLVGSSVSVIVDPFACTYSLSIQDGILADYSIDVCGQSSYDFGVFTNSPSMGAFVINPKLGNLPLPPFGQPLTKQITDRTYAGTVPIDLTLTYNISPLSIRITNVQTPTAVGPAHTFISTDPITLIALVTPTVSGLPVEWTVTGLKGAAGVTGLPTKEVHNIDADGVSTFTFTPNTIASFVNNRKTRFTGGSRAPNQPIAFEVVATLNHNGLPISSILSETLQFLEQDNIDTLRQEYQDILQPVPTRSEIVPTLGTPWNKGNYNVQRDNNLQARRDSILAAYRGLSVTNAGLAVTIPAGAQISVSSAFRCPQLNKAIGSVHPESLHTRGRALDLVPLPVTVIVNGTAVNLDLHNTLYPALDRAVRSQGLSSLPEQSAIPVPLGDPRENHIHTQW